MFVPSSYAVALVTALLSMCCWGSWSNFLVAAGDKIRFELFYINMSASVFLTSVAAAFTLGMVSTGGKGGEHSFLHDYGNVSMERFLLSFLAGLVFNVANLLLCKGIAMLGLALAFPLCIGTALVLGTVVTYAIQEDKADSNAVLLFVGVFVAFAAVCAAAAVHRCKEQQLQSHRSTSADADEVLFEQVPGESSSGEPSLARKLVVCIVGGILMGLWNPLVALAEAGDHGVSPYSNLIFYTLAVFLSSLAIAPLIIMYPIEGGKGSEVSSALYEYRTANRVLHVYGFAGGLIWCLGTLANAVAGNSGILSSAESYAIGQCANMIAIFWGVFYFREFEGTNWVVKGGLVLVCLLYVLAIALIALSSKA